MSFDYRTVLRAKGIKPLRGMLRTERLPGDLELRSEQSAVKAKRIGEDQ